MRWLTKLFFWGGVALFGVGALAAVAGSQVLPPGTEGPASDCAGQVPIVVGADEAAQSDLYSAATLAGVIETSCIVLAGPRDGEFPADQLARLDAALDDESATGWVMGGEAAVPEAKVAGRGLKRLNGVDRWHTARLAGAIAADPGGDVAALTEATAPAEGELGGGSVIVDGVEVRLPPGLDAPCDGQVPIVVAVDAAAQSDLYSAATLAGVLDTTCYVLAGARGEPMSAEQRARLEAAAGDGWIVGGDAAVPPEKVEGFGLERQGGADRWATARVIGATAVAQAAAATSTTTTTERVVRRSSGGGGGGSSRSGGSSRVPTRTPSPAAPAVPSPGTTSTTTTTEPQSTTTTVPDDTTTSTTAAGSGETTTTTTEPPRMASEFMPSVSVEVPQLGGTAGANIWAGETFEVTLARAGGAHAECTGVDETLTYTVQDSGVVMLTAGSLPAMLIGTLADDTTTCDYTVTFPAALADTLGGDFDWTMTAPAQTQVTVSEASQSATGAYTVGDVTFAPDATIAVPAGNDGVAFDVAFAGDRAACSGNPTALTHTYTVPSGGTSAAPAAANSPLLIAYPSGATASADVCSYTVTFPPNENGALMALVLQTGADTSATGTDQGIAAAYAPPPMASSFVPMIGVTVPGLDDVSGDNIWATQEFEVMIARESGAHPDCSLGTAATVTYTVQVDGTVTTSDDDLPETLLGTLIDQTTKCRYEVTFPAAPNDSPGGDFDWTMTAPATVPLSDADMASMSATGAYTVSDVTFAPDATITVEAGYDGAAFGVEFVGDRAACSGNPSAVTLTYIVPTDGTSAEPDTTNNEPLIAYPAGATASSDLCEYAVTFPQNENDGTTLDLQDGTDATATGTDQAIAATYAPAMRGVSSGETFSCARQSDGSVFCWGDNAHDQLDVPDLAEGVAFTQVSTGASHACALTTAGALRCWGNNADGRTTVPPLAGGATFTAVDVGWEHSCGLTSEGAVECWGSDDSERLGTVPELTGGATFTQVSTGALHSCAITSDETIECWGSANGMVAGTQTGSFTSVSVGSFYACAITTGGEVQCWGTAFRDRTNAPSGTFTSVSAGRQHTCGVKTDGTVTCWGGDADNLRAAPNVLFSTVSTGTLHACGLTQTGSVACWGYGNFGQATAPSGAFAEVSAGWYHSCGITTGGATQCWGANSDMQSDVPMLGEGESFTQISGGERHTCGVKDDNTVACWGYDGPTNANGRVSDAPSAATDLFSAVTAGDTHSCGIRSGGDTDGTIVCWGHDNREQLMVPAPGDGKKYTAVDAGGEHSCALKDDMSVECWGYNGFHPGDGRVSDKPAATDLFTSLAVGDSYACAVRATGGAVRCWGDNAASQATPPTGAFSAVAAGVAHTCGIRSGGDDAGTVVCWGSNNVGQTDAPDGTFASLTAGRYHTCGIRSGDDAGAAVCWGAGTAWGVITVRPPSA